METTVKVRGLTKNVTEAHINEIFGAYGRIKFIKFPIDTRFGFNLGYADIEFETREEALLAIEGWNGGQLDGEIVETGFASKMARTRSPPRRPERPMRAPRVPLSPPRRGGRNFSPPPPRDRRRQDRYSPPPRRGFERSPVRARRGTDYYSPPRRSSGGPPTRPRGVNAAPLGPRGAHTIPEAVVVAPVAEKLLLEQLSVVGATPLAEAVRLSLVEA
ncbi:hypothetical protein BGZ83_010052 [Gryganskiella cystojenkinii]|nr:hypothetical protein BGZ83_010052 [Gryganskiella cystojenkinii]